MVYLASRQCAVPGYKSAEIHICFQDVKSSEQKSSDRNLKLWVQSPKRLDKQTFIKGRSRVVKLKYVLALT